MANRYWVGGAGTWNASDTSHWSTSSGGASGASVPTLSDAVIFDSNSTTGAFTVTVSGSVNCLTFSASTGSGEALTINASSSDSINVYGSSLTTGSSGDTITSGFNGWLNIYGNTIIQGFSVFKNTLFGNGVSAALAYSVTTTIDEIKISNAATVTIRNDTRIAKITALTATSTLPRINVGWSSNQNADLYVTGSTDCINGAINIYTSYTNAKLYIEPSTGYCSMRLGEILSLYNAQTGTIQSAILKPLSVDTVFTISGFAVFTNIFKEAGTPACTLQFEPSTNPLLGFYFENFSASGEVGNLLTVKSSIDGTRALLTKTGGGTVSTNYVEVRDMQPSPDNTWISYNSVNSGNNYQWYFDDFEKPTSNLFFGNAL